METSFDTEKYFGCLSHDTEMQSIILLHTLLRKPVFHSTPQLSDVYHRVIILTELFGLGVTAGSKASNY